MSYILYLLSFVLCLQSSVSNLQPSPASLSSTSAHSASSTHSLCYDYRMEITLTTPALLFPAIAILMLGYVNRYLGAANVIRTFKKDYDSGYEHTQITLQLQILQKRIELFKYMLSVAMAGLALACISMFFIFLDFQLTGKISFGLSLLAMISSMILSLYETTMSNRSLLVEIQDIFEKETSAKQK